MKINNISVSPVEFQNSLVTLKYVLLNNEKGIETTWPVVSCDGHDVYLNYNIDKESDFGYMEETRLADNASITCSLGSGCFWTSYPEE